MVMNAQITTLTDNTLGHILDTVSHAEKDGSIQVTVENKTKDRSSLQNRLSHKWYSVIGKQTFESEVEVKRYCKLTFGIPIMIRDVEGFAGMWGIQTTEMTYEQEKWSMKFMKLTSILSVEQMTEYLNQMKLHYESENIYLPTKDDLYARAMGYTERKA